MNRAKKVKPMEPAPLKITRCYRCDGTRETCDICGESPGRDVAAGSRGDSQMAMRFGSTPDAGCGECPVRR